MMKRQSICLHAVMPAMVLCAAVASCVREQTEPTVFTASPAEVSLTADRQIAGIEIRSDLAWEASLKDGSWCTISCDVSQKPSVAGKISLSASFNADAEERTDTVTVVSGTQVLSIPVNQLGVGSVVAPTRLEVSKSVPSSFVVHTNEPWSAGIAAAEAGDDISWLEAYPLSAGAGHTTVTVSARVENLDVIEGRKAIIRLSLGGSTVDVTVFQPGPHYPFMDENAYGVYDLDGRDWIADPGVSQIGLKGYADSYSFRILYPGSDSVIEISGLRYSYRLGQTAEFQVRALSGDVSSSRTVKATVLQQDEATLWMRSAEGHSFIIKTFEGR
ncbi:MAG: BACON domain-containing protein [Bacteroidales bacterium]|nr:BACON domain-containing protein [Candidatus Cryptobacteroides onthequi]